MDELKDKIVSDSLEIEKEWKSVADIQAKLSAMTSKIAESKKNIKAQALTIEAKEQELTKALKEYENQTAIRDELEKKSKKLKEKEDYLIAEDINIRKERENVVNMRLKMNEEMRQIGMQRRVLESLKSELDAAKPPA